MCDCIIEGSLTSASVHWIFWLTYSAMLPHPSHRLWNRLHHTPVRDNFQIAQQAHLRLAPAELAPPWAPDQALCPARLQGPQLEGS